MRRLFVLLGVALLLAGLLVQAQIRERIDAFDLKYQERKAAGRISIAKPAPGRITITITRFDPETGATRQASRTFPVSVLADARAELVARRDELNVVIVDLDAIQADWQALP